METMWQRITDEIGPAQILLIHDAQVGLDAIAIIDNAACGPAIGGVRMRATVTLEEISRMARAMTLKSAAAGLPHGGCKAGILADPGMPPLDKERTIRAFGRAIRGLADFIPGPDMGTDETCMGYLQDEIGRAVGLPRSLGGIPLDEIGATGFGLAVCVATAHEHLRRSLIGVRVAVQGFGAVGRHAARYLAERRAVIVAVSDSRGGVHAADGLDVPELLAHKAAGESVHRFPAGQPISHDEMVTVDCDVWIPAAQPDVLTADNAPRLRARLIVPGANIPATPEAESILRERGVLVVPDFIANAGGLICAAVEYRGGTQSQALAAIEEKIATNTRAVLEHVDRGVAPRVAANDVALARVRDGMRYRRRGWAPHV